MPSQSHALIASASQAEEGAGAGAGAGAGGTGRGRQARVMNESRPAHRVCMSAPLAAQTTIFLVHLILGVLFSVIGVR